MSLVTFCGWNASVVGLKWKSNAGASVTYLAFGDSLEDDGEVIIVEGLVRCV